jgi:hypothetical protein
LRVHNRLGVARRIEQGMPFSPAVEPAPAKLVPWMALLTSLPVLRHAGEGSSRGRRSSKMLAAARPTGWQGTFAARSALIFPTPAQRHDQEY